MPRRGSQNRVDNRRQSDGYTIKGSVSIGGKYAILRFAVASRPRSSPPFFGGSPRAVPVGAAHRPSALCLAVPQVLRMATRRELNTATEVGVPPCVNLGPILGQRGEFIWIMSSRLAARAAARSLSRSSICASRATFRCCSSMFACCMASMSSGAPRPESRHTCSPMKSDRRLSRCWIRSWRRLPRDWALASSARSEAWLGPGPVLPVAAVCACWRCCSRSGMPVEVRPVDAGRVLCPKR